MRLRTEYTYNSGESTINVVIDTDFYNRLGGPEALTPEQILSHIEAIYAITGCPKAPTDKEMDDMEAYFSEDE